MISFQSRNSAIRQADRITRSVNSIYPHISESKTKKMAEHQQFLNYPDKICYKLGNLKLKNSIKIDTLRYKHREGIDLFRDIIDMLKNHKIGNCYESAVVAEIIGKINGIKNIYPSKIFFNKNSSGYQTQLDHVVAIITDNSFMPDRYYSFKNKDAIIIDPWLGITEFAGDYINKLRTNFVNIFSGIPDYKDTSKFLKRTTNNIEEFKKTQKYMFKPDFSFKLHVNEVLSIEDANTLKNEYPELVIKDFKKSSISR